MHEFRWVEPMYKIKSYLSTSGAVSLILSLDYYAVTIVAYTHLDV
uniref:Uncharacterized protein n=1 Tax=Rhizophora mucronata TaxID=61149 RepID=A0A2P2NHP7_RHIMU